jgi:hypothetical protein
MIELEAFLQTWTALPCAVLFGGVMVVPWLMFWTAMGRA